MEQLNTIGERFNLKDATLSVYRADLSPDEFNIFRSRRVEVAKVSDGKMDALCELVFKSDVWIIDGGHAARFETQDGVLSEVVSVGLWKPTEALKSLEVLNMPLDAPKVAHTEKSARLKYHFDSRKLLLESQADYEEKYLEIVELKASTLHYDFKLATGGKFKPFVSVTIQEPQGGVFEMESVHAYPAEKAFIHTQTQVGFEQSE